MLDKFVDLAAGQWESAHIKCPHCGGWAQAQTDGCIKVYHCLMCARDFPILPLNREEQKPD